MTLFSGSGTSASQAALAANALADGQARVTESVDIGTNYTEDLTVIRNTLVSGATGSTPSVATALGAQMDVGNAQATFSARQAPVNNANQATVQAARKAEQG